MLKTLVLGLLIAMSASAVEPTLPKLHALIITGQNNHDWRATTPVLRKLLEDTGRFDVRVTEEFRGATADTLAPYDVVVLNYYDGANRWPAPTEQALLNFLRNGKGLVLYHFSAAAFNGWDEYEKLSAGNWRPNNGHHSAKHDFEVTIRDPKHPAVQGIASFTEVNDELYANLKWQPADTFHILATAWDDHKLYNGKAKQPTPGDGLDQPMLWAVQYGAGRVFATALGHDPEAMKSEGFTRTFTQGTRWAATGQ